MNETSEILEWSGLSSDEILQRVQRLLEESDFERFMVVIKRKEKKNQSATVRSRTSKKRAETKHSFNIGRRPTESSNRYAQRNSESGCEDNGVAKGIALYHEEFFDEALQVLQDQEEELVQSYGNQCASLKLYQEVVFHMGNCHYRLKNYQKAVQYYTKKCEGEEPRQQAHKYNNLGTCYAHLQQSRMSLNSYAQALKIYSDYPDVDCSNLLHNLGLLYAQSKMFDTAQKYFLQSVQERKTKSPDSESLLYSSYLQLGNCQKYAQKYHDAIATCKIALEYAKRGKGSEIETLYMLASIYEILEKWAEALNCYQLLSQTDKGAFLFERAAYVHRYMGHMSDFERFIERAYEYYRDEQNERKVSELQPIITQIHKK